LPIVVSDTNSSESGVDRLEARGARRMRFAAAFACGALAALGQAPFSFAMATVAGFVGAMMLLVVAGGPRRAAWLGWSVGAGYFLVALHWIVEPFLVDVDRHGWMAPFALIGLAGGLSLFWGAAFGAAAWLATRQARPLALVLTLSLAEWMRSTVLSGFPWALPAYAWGETPVIHVAALVGPFGLTLLTLLAAAGVAMALQRGRAPLWALAGAGPLTLLALFGAWDSRGLMVEAPEAPVIRLVQPNAPQDEKWHPDRAMTFVRRQIDLTAEAPAPDLVVWPESAIPWRLGDAGPILEQASDAARGAPVILGATRMEAGRAYNSLAVIGADGEVVDTYDKHHLVPFGEFIPLGRLARFLGLRSFAARDGYGFAAGEGARRIDLGWLGQPLPLICYEAIFPAEVGAGERPSWLLQITNDAWFGTFSGPYQHLAQARFRAVEQGLPMVRVANTGVSAVIDARGDVVTSMPLGQGGYVDAALPPAASPTPYARTGDAPFLVALALGLVAAIVLRNRALTVR
jgi:apolipoprotein N-acyltransferase